MRYIIHDQGAYNLFDYYLGTAVFRRAVTRSELLTFMRRLPKAQQRGLEDKLVRAEAKGVSRRHPQSFGSPLYRLLLLNRAGPDGRTVNVYAFIDRFLKLPAEFKQLK